MNETSAIAKTLTVKDVVSRLLQALFASVGSLYFWIGFAAGVIVHHALILGVL